MNRTRASRPKRLDRRAFSRPAVELARDLLGKIIVRRGARARVAAMIVEAEAYVGPEDRAAHSFGGRRTARVEPLYSAGGTAYVYFCYGMHWLFNVSAAGRGEPQGVLIRAIEVEARGERRRIVGPARVTRFLSIDGRTSGEDLTRSKALWIEDRGIRVPKQRIRAGPRVGVDYAGRRWAAKPWRFWIEPARSPRDPRSRRA